MRIAGSSINILEFPGDSQEQSCIGIVKAAVQRFGRIDVRLPIPEDVQHVPKLDTSALAWKQGDHINLLASLFDSLS